MGIESFFQKIGTNFGRCLSDSNPGEKFTGVINVGMRFKKAIPAPGTELFFLPEYLDVQIEFIKTHNHGEMLYYFSSGSFPHTSDSFNLGLHFANEIEFYGLKA